MCVRQREYENETKWVAFLWAFPFPPVLLSYLGPQLRDGTAHIMVDAPFNQPPLGPPAQIHRGVPQ